MANCSLYIPVWRATILNRMGDLLLCQKNCRAKDEVGKAAGGNGRMWKEHLQGRREIRCLSSWIRNWFFDDSIMNFVLIRSHPLDWINKLLHILKQNQAFLPHFTANHYLFKISILVRTFDVNASRMRIWQYTKTYVIGTYVSGAPMNCGTLWDRPSNFPLKIPM